MTLNELFPEIETFDEGRLNVSNLHEIYYEQSGNPVGKPIVFLHGGLVVEQIQNIVGFLILIFIELFYLIKEDLEKVYLMQKFVKIQLRI